MCELASIIKIHGGHRMSDSLVTKLKNKITYRVKTAVEDLVNDPDANAYAKEQAEKKDKVEPLDTDIPTTAAELKDAAKAKADEANGAIPRDKFSAKRTFNQVWDYIVMIFEAIRYPLLVLILAMLIANEMIMYSAPIRAIFFAFIIIICSIATFPAGILTIYYLCKGGYSYYVNNMSDGPKQRIMPTIFAILPILMNKERPWYTRYLLYPFTYPKVPKKVGILKEIMDEHFQTLQNSFPFAKKVIEQGGMEEFKEQFDKAKEYLDTMHDVSMVVFPSQAEQTAEPPLPPTVAEVMAKREVPPANNTLPKVINTEKESPPPYNNGRSSNVLPPPYNTNQQPISIETAARAAKAAAEVMRAKEV
uniref:Uncharacterized protein n=1 Tax=viral metagenome TaxID=1070528 RepID=A0A6C0KSD9_9ZZZZ